MSLIWAYETPSISFAQAAFQDGRTHLVHYAPAGVTAQCIDKQGNVLYATTTPFPFTTLPGPAFSEASSTKQLAVGHCDGTPSQAVEIVTLDPNGGIIWTKSQSAAWSVSEGAYTDKGDLVVIEARAVGQTATRFERSIATYGYAGRMTWLLPKDPPQALLQVIFPDATNDPVGVNDQLAVPKVAEAQCAIESVG